MKWNRLLVSVLLLLSVTAGAQQADQLVAQGNVYFRQQQYTQAEALYRKALTADPANNKALLNLATTLYHQEKTGEAKTIFNAVATEGKDPAQKSLAYYNYGVIMTHEKKLDESIEAYKNALRNNPADNEARENLQKALMEQKKKQDKNQDQKKKENKKQDQKPQSKLSQKEAEQKLKLLEQKEKEAQRRLQKDKAGAGTNRPKDW